jgi:predicted ATP-dependent serine protease
VTEAKRELIVTSLDTVNPERMTWLWDKRIPVGLTVLAGRGGIGKSTVLAWITAHATRGTLDGDYFGTPVTVGLISSEDDAATTTVPRLRVAGADLSRVLDLSAVATGDGEGNRWTELPTFRDDLPELRRVISEHDVKLLIIDPQISLSTGDPDKLGDTRRNLNPVHALAAELGISIVGVAHFNKSQNGKAGDAVSGSAGIRDIARSLLLLELDGNTEHRILEVDKSNYTRPPDNLKFELTDAVISGTDLDPVGRAELLGTTQLTVQAIRERERPSGERSMEVLDLLRSSPEPIAPKDVETALGIDNNQASMILTRLVRRGQAVRTSYGKYIAAEGVEPVGPVVLGRASTTPTSATTAGEPLYSEAAT